MDHDLIRAVVLAQALPAAFEAACLIRCTDVGLPERPRPNAYAGTMAGTAGATALAEFDRPDAAERFASLLSELGHRPQQEVRTGGGRRRWEVHQVGVPDTQRLTTSRMLATAWRQGTRSMLGTDLLGASSRRSTQRHTLAYAAWRAALYAGGRRIRSDVLGVGLAHHEMAAVLVRAARLLDVPAQTTRRPGCLLITVSAAEAARLLEHDSAAFGRVAAGRHDALSG